VVFTDMQKEYIQTDKQCVQCHMGPKKEGFASSLPIDHGKPRKRMVREHSFMGAHVNRLWKGALGMTAQKEGDKIAVTISNPNPHNIPSGFGARELILEILFYDGSKKVLSQKSISLTAHYLDRHGKATIPHLATKITETPSIPAHGEKRLIVPIVRGAKEVHMTLYYRLVNNEVRSLLHLKEPQWSEKKFITQTSLQL